MVSLFWVLLLTCVLLLSVKKEYDCGLLKKEFTETTKGIMMWFIVVHHILIVIGHPYALYFMARVGYLATGIFFFISGYGNWMSINKNKSIKWLSKRLTRLYKAFFSFFVLCLLSNTLSNIMQNKSIKVDWLKLLKDVAIFSLPDNVNWFPKVFVVTIVLLYLLKRVVKNNIVCLFLLTGSIIAYIIVCICVVRTESYWYNSVLCFAMGCFTGEYRDKVEDYIQGLNNTLRFVVGIFGITFFVIVFPYLADQIYEPFFVQPLHALIVCGIVAVLSTVVTINNRFLKFCGQYSFEIYLAHLAIWKNEFLMDKGIIVYSLAVVVLTILIVRIYAFVDSKKRIYYYLGR